LWLAETPAQRAGVHSCTYKLKTSANLRTINQGNLNYLLLTLMLPKNQVKSKRWCLYTKLHGVTSQHTIIFIHTAVITSNLTVILYGDVIRGGGAGFSELLVSIYQTSRRHVSEYSNVHSHSL
jgi:hypothetical protein